MPEKYEIHSIMNNKLSSYNSFSASRLVPLNLNRKKNKKTAKESFYVKKLL